jgi:phage pi2 protein 07
MILTLPQLLKLLVLSFLLSTFILPLGLQAQESQTLSVSPTLLNMSANPTQEWQSSVRVINTNSYELNVYVDVVNFAPQGESGQGMFISADTSDESKDTFAEWIEIENKQLTIAPEQTLQIPFTIKVPEDAPPGGHFVALLIGTRPPQDESGVTKVETSQVITSLIFLRVAGDVNESGLIREFKTSSSILESPEADFILRFENNGNVHLQPQGEIKIFNMWGQERGVVPVNQRTLFGNVLPQSIRAYNFSWKGEWSVSDIGRYTAVATLAYGDDERQFASLGTAFWIIPWKVLGSIVLILGAFIALFTWATRAYIRHMLKLAQVGLVSQNDVRVPVSKVSVVAPLEAGILDLRSRLRNDRTSIEFLQTILSFIKTYRSFFIVVSAAIVFLVTVGWFIRSASAPDRGYEFTIEESATSIEAGSVAE